MSGLPDAAEGTCPEGDLPPALVGDITEVLQALADPMRLAIVRSLAESGAPRACSSFDLPVHKSTLSHHFRVLREAGLTEHRCQGTWKLISLRRPELDAAYPGLLDSVLRAPTGEPAGR